MSQPSLDDDLAERSARFMAHGSIEDLARCAELLPRYEHDIAAHLEILWLINSYLFLVNKGQDSADIARFQNELLFPSYLRVVRDLRRQFFDQLPTLDHWRARTAPKDRALFVASRFTIATTAAISLATAAYASGLTRRLGLETLILNTRTIPIRRRSRFAGARYPGDATADGFFMNPCPDGGFQPIYSVDSNLSGLDHIGHCLEIARNFAPNMVVSYANFNLIGDLLAERLPTAFVSMSHAQPVSLAHAYIFFDRNTPENWFEALPTIGHRPTYHHFAYAFPLLPKTAEIRRADRGLPDDGFLVAMVGFRLRSEVTIDVELALARMLASDPSIWIWLIGVEQFSPRHDALSAFSHRIRSSVELDVRSAVCLCDVYLNPPRQGGGHSAQIALAEALPTLTGPTGDVAAIIGHDQAQTSFDAAIDLVIACVRDPEVLAAERRRARHLFAKLPSVEKNIVAYWRALKDTVRRFANPNQTD